VIGTNGKGVHVKNRLVCAMLLSLVVSVSVVPLASAKNLKIAMVLWRGETDAEQGFKEGLKDLGYSVQYTVMNAGQDRAELGRLLREDLKPKLDGVDYVYSYGTTATLATKSIVQDKTPIIFVIVADPVGAGVVRSMEVSGGNIAGVSNEVALDLQIKTALTVVPFKRLGFLFNPREKNSMLIREKLVEVTRPLGIEVVDVRSAPVQDMLQENLQKLRDRTIAVDAVYLPADSFHISSAKLIGTELRAARVKSIAALDTYIDQGALTGVVPDYNKLGKAAATIVHRHQGGQKLQDMPVETDKDPLLKINGPTSRALGVTIPDAIRKRAVIVE
jgi:putative tryptophan/tyrosine transport system substrate-binding protein